MDINEKLKNCKDRFCVRLNTDNVIGRINKLILVTK